MLQLSSQVSLRIQEFSKKSNQNPQAVLTILERDYLLPMLDNGLLSMPQKEKFNTIKKAIRKLRVQNGI